MENTTRSNVTAVKYCCTENGEGIRTSIFFAGCNLHCPGCFNQEAWNFDSGVKMSDKLIKEILDSVEPYYIDGISILGGEPMDPRNQASVAYLIKKFKERYGDTKDIWLWTGYTLKTIPKTEDTKYILKQVDYIVDGPFISELKDPNLDFRGSSNQNIYFHLKKIN